MADKVTVELKQDVTERAHGCCEYCRSQERFAMQVFSVEHIEPRSKEGKTSLNNLALACQGCNNHKYVKTESSDPVSGNLVQLFHPRKQRWQEHFAWADDYTRIVGVTSTGRATVEALQLNRQGLINMRQILYAAGEHPPPDSHQE